MERIFDDLFAYPEHALCHLQVFASDRERVFIATELEDNPGASLVNAAEGFARSLEEAFGPVPQRTFLCFPGERTHNYELIDALGEDGPMFRRDVADDEIRNLAGRADAVNAHESYTAAEVGGEHHPLLALIPPPEQDVDLRDEFEVVAVADLPWPHNPSRCVHSDRYETIRRFYGQEFEGHVPAGAHWFLTLTPEDTACCPYHRPDWRTIAAASVDLLNELPSTGSSDDLFRTARERVSGANEAKELVFLFSDPIIWTPRTKSITNGQHRTCALKTANAPFVVVATGRETRFEEPVPADPRRRAQSALAEYWARTLGD